MRVILRAAKEALLRVTMGVLNRVLIRILERVCLRETLILARILTRGLGYLCLLWELITLKEI